MKLLAHLIFWHMEEIHYKIHLIATFVPTQIQRTCTMPCLCHRNDVQLPEGGLQVSSNMAPKIAHAMQWLHS